MPQKGLKKDDGVRGRREEISSKFFPFFPDHKSTFIGNRANNKEGRCKMPSSHIANYWYGVLQSNTEIYGGAQILLLRESHITQISYLSVKKEGCCKYFFCSSPLNS